MELKYTQNDNLIFSSKNCAILGSNWTWKSSLCKNLYRLNLSNNVEYIRAQRDLSIHQGGLKGLDEEVLEKWLSSYSLVAVWSDLNTAHLTNPKVLGNSNNIIQNDFNKNIEKFFRDNQAEHADASMNYEDWDFQKPNTNADKIFEVWNNIFLDKEIKISWWKIKVFLIHEQIIENMKLKIFQMEKGLLYIWLQNVYTQKKIQLL